MAGQRPHYVQGRALVTSRHEGFIYFALQEEPQPDLGLSKIGWSGGNPAARVSSLQTGNPFPLKLVATVKGTRSDEALIHAGLADYHVRGEWFALEGVWRSLGRLWRDPSEALQEAGDPLYIVARIEESHQSHGEEMYCGASAA